MTHELTNCELAENALLRAEKLYLEATRCTEEFLATLGHEMRNPLNALNGALQIWPSIQHDQGQMGDLHQLMERQVKQLTHLSDGLFDIGRTAQGKMELRQEQIELQQVIDNACEEVQPYIRQCDHELAVSRSSKPMIVFGDAPRLLQVFANLIQNAAKFTSRGGSLSIQAEPLDGMAVVRVRDTGSGIEERLLPAIFDALKGYGDHQPLAHSGLGIGLRLVKTIVELHGGTVGVQSKGLGQGSEFTVSLPLHTVPVPGDRPSSPDASARPEELASQLESLRILVVDDFRPSVEMLALMLRAIGQTVSVAENGREAIRTVLAERPQVVILDILLEDMNGCEVARRLRGCWELDGLVLIALSGNGDAASRQRAKQAGFDRHLVKPVGMALLAETLAGISTKSNSTRGRSSQIDESENAFQRLA